MTNIAINFATNAAAVSKEIQQSEAALKRSTAAIEAHDKAVRKATDGEKKYSEGQRGIRGVLKAVGGAGGQFGMLGGLSEKLGLSPALGALAVGAVALRATMKAVSYAYERNIATIGAEIEARTEHNKRINSANRKLESAGLSAVSRDGQSLTAAIALAGPAGKQLSDELNKAGVKDAERVAATLAQLPEDIRGAAASLATAASRTGLVTASDAASAIAKSPSQFLGRGEGEGIAGLINAARPDMPGISGDAVREMLQRVQENPLTQAIGRIQEVQGQTRIAEQLLIPQGEGAARLELGAARDGGLAMATIEAYRVQREQLDKLEEIHNRLGSFEAFVDILKGSESIRVRHLAGERQAGLVPDAGAAQ